MKALVTGGAGFIGSHIVDRLLSMGYEVIVIDNEYSDNENFNWREESQNHKYDICDYENTRSLYDGVDYVFHTAAEARIGPAIQNPVNAVNINALGTCTVLQCAREAGVKKVMYSSTSAAYGLNQSPNIETQPNDCLNPYSVSKVAGEELCKMYTRLYGLRTIIFRYFNVYGEDSPVTGPYSLVIGIFLQQKKEGKPLTLVGSGDSLRDFVHVKDVVEINIKAMMHETPLNAEVFNVGSGKHHKVRDIAKFISSDIIEMPKRIGEAKTTLADIEKAKSILKWHPNIDLFDWLNKLNN